jgi:hypothetical protein
VNPAVERLLGERGAQGFERHCEDDAALDVVARLLNVNSGAPMSKGAAAKSNHDRRHSQGRRG